MENLLSFSLLVTATAMSFPLALLTARFTLRMLFRAIRVRSQSNF